MRKFLLTLLSMICMTAVSFAAEQTHTVIFKSGTGTTDSSTERTERSALNTVIDQDDDNCISGILSASKIYNGREGYGLKFGSGSAAGNIEFILTNPLKITKIEAQIARYGATEGTTVTINNVSNSFKSDVAALTFADYTFEYPEAAEVETIKISTASKRAFVKQIVITYDDGQQAEVANMAVSMITRGSYYSSTDSRIEISEELYLTRVYNDWHTTGADDSFTMAGWFKLNAKTSLAGGSMIMGLTAQAHNNINGSLAIGLDTSGNYKLICGDKDSGNRTAVEGSTTTAMTTGEWHYLTLSYDAATLTVKMYADGKELKSGTLAGNLRLFPDNPGIISLGAAQFDGAVDEFQFWGRALTADEVLAAMVDANAVEGIKGFYDFNRGTDGQFANAVETYNYPAQYFTTSGSTSSDGGTTGVRDTAATPSMTEGRPEAVAPTFYALTVEDNGATVTVMAGETAVDDLTAITEGTELTVSVEAPAHYTVAAVKLGEEALTANEDGTYTITMDADKTLTVELAAINFGVTVEANGATVVFRNGEEVVEDLTAILEGTELTFTVVAPEGKVVESVKAGEEVLTPSEEGVYTITVDADKTITVTLADAAPVANMAVDLFTRESWWSGSDSRVVISEELYLTREYADDVWHTTGADDSFTMAGWFRLDKKTSLAGGTMVMGLTAQAHNNINGSLAIGVDTDGNYKLICGDGTNNADVAGSTTTAMTTEEWHYLTLSYDAATLTVKMYADGKELKSGTLAGNLRLFPDNPGIISLGAAQFDGAVDEFQFWGRALSADEVKAAMLNAKTVEGIKGFYDFNVADSEGKFANAIAGYNYSAQTFNTSGSYSTDGGTTGVINTPMTTPPLTEGRPDMTAPATYAVTVEANGATVEFRNGETVVPAEELAAIEEGTELTFTVVAPEGKVVESVKADDEALTASEEGVYTITVNADMTITVTLADAGISYTAPDGESNAENYLTTISSTGAVENLDLSYTENPGIYNVIEGLSTYPGSTFNLNLVAFSLGEKSETIVREDIRFTQAYIFTDFNADGQWEYVKTLGDFKPEPPKNVSGNYDEVMDITEAFTLPAETEVGTMTRIRVIYQNAWTNLGSGTNIPDPNAQNLDKGIAYDFVIETVEAPAYAVTVEANGATVEFKKGEEVIEDLTAITAGTDLSFTVAAPEYTEVASVTANDVELTATEGVYTFTVTAPTTIVVTLNELERPNMAVVMPGRTSNTADNRIEISEKLYLTRDYNNDWHTTGENDSFTMSGWFKLTSYTSYPGGAVIMGLGARAHNNVNASLGIGLNAYGNYTVICGDGNNKDGIAVTIDKQMTTDEWHYLTLTYDAASLDMTFYADGEILHKATFGSALRLFPDNPGIITLGAAQFIGSVDEFQFWGRALSGDEVRIAMVNATEISEGLKALYDFNAGSKGSYANAIAEYEFPAKYYTTVGTSNGGDGGIISVSPVAATPQSTEGRVLADIVAPTVYAVSFQMPEGTTVDAKVNNKAMIDPEQIIAGSTLTFTVATPADKQVDTVEINSVEATATEGVYTATVDTDLDVIITLKEFSSILTIGIDGAEGEIEVFNLNGVRVDADNIVPGIYIVRQGGMTQKVLVK